MVNLKNPKGVEVAEPETPDLVEENEKLSKSLASLAGENEKLKKELSKYIKVEVPAEPTIRLRWTHSVDNAQGLAPTAYGLPLYIDKDGYYADIPVSRAKIELQRAHPCFIKHLKKELEG